MTGYFSVLAYAEEAKGTFLGTYAYTVGMSNFIPAFFFLLGLVGFWADTTQTNEWVDALLSPGTHAAHLALAELKAGKTLSVGDPQLVALASFVVKQFHDANGAHPKTTSLGHVALTDKKGLGMSGGATDGPLYLAYWEGNPALQASFPDLEAAVEAARQADMLWWKRVASAPAFLLAALAIPVVNKGWNRLRQSASRCLANLASGWHHLVALALWWRRIKRP